MDFYEDIKRKKNLRANQGHHHKQFLSQVSTNEKYCFVCGGTGKVLRINVLRVALAGENYQCGNVPQSAGLIERSYQRKKASKSNIVPP